MGRMVLVITFYNNGEPFRNVSMNRHLIKQRLRNMKHRIKKYATIRENSNGEFVECSECSGEGFIKFRVL